MIRRGLVVGLSGVSCGGKTTITKLLKASFPWASIIHQDAYYYPDDSKHHVLVPELNHNNWDLKSALDIKKMESDLSKTIRNFHIRNTKDFNDSNLEKVRFFQNDQFVSTKKPKSEEVSILVERFGTIPITILEGHIIFNHDFFNKICDLKYFLYMEEEECKKRRSLRVYDPPNPKGYFEKVVWPIFKQRFAEVQKLDHIEFINAQKIPLFNIYEKIYDDIIHAMEQSIKSSGRNAQSAIDASS